MGCATSSEQAPAKAKPKPSPAKNDAKGGGVLDQPEIKAIRSDFTVGEHLQQIPLFAKLSKAERAKLGGAMVEETFMEASTVITQGDKGDMFYLIRNGSAAVTFKDKDGTETEVARLHQGDYFGETALVTDAPRGATVTALEELTCLCMDKSKFTSLFGENKFQVAFGKRKAVTAEVFKRAAVSEEQDKDRDRDKSDTVKDIIHRAIGQNVLFSGLDEEQTRQIVDEMWRMEVKKGKVVIKQGESGDNFYVVEKGLCLVTVQPKDKDGDVIKLDCGPATSFGELALMYNAPRGATVEAMEDSTLWAISRRPFRRIVCQVSDNKLHHFQEILQSVPLISSLLAEERAAVADLLEEVAYDPGQVVIRQGDHGDSFYIIRSGEAVVSKKEEDGEESEVKRLTSGQFFGERALLKDEARAATITADPKSKEKLECLTLNRHTFSVLLGPLGDLLERNAEQYEKKSTQQMVTSNMVDIRFEDLEVLGTLGRGAFGHVQLVKDKSGATYALKGVNKAQIVDTGQQDHIMNEKSVMAQMNSRFLINLRATYNRKSKLYFLLEVALGGELFSVLRKRGLFDEPTARFFAGCVVLAFEYMHSKNIVYRDLKPENLMITDTGYLKVTDFGFAKVVTDRTWTLCGTPDYLAPEIIAGKGHGKGVDWWTLGILIYEMLASYCPFYDNDQMKSYQKIIIGKVKYPGHFSPQAVDLVSKLLQPKPSNRLGVVKGGADNIKNHPWFAGFDWNALQNGTMKAPLRPKVASPTDMSNFDDYPPEDDYPNAYYEDGSGWDRDF